MNLKLVLGLALCRPVVGRVISGVFGGRVPSRGFVIDTRSPHISPVTVASIFWGLYEHSEIRLVHQWLRRDLDVLELGSSLGLVALSIARVQAPERRLICMEANPDLIDTLRTNFTLNVPWKPVEILNRAIDYSGQSEIAVRIDPGNLGSDKSPQAGGRLVRVRTVTLRQLLAQYRIGDYALVSDIEGAEAEILEEDREALARCRQIVVELHPASYGGQTYSVEALEERLQTCGFELVVRRRRVYVFNKNP